METFTDYYRVLRVGRTADAATIKTAFRRLARRYHPDVAADKRAPGRFQRVREAYEVLSDPERRRAYDDLSRARRAALRPRRYRHGRPDITQPPHSEAAFVVALDLLRLRIDIAAGSRRSRR
jgi:curved DNA-binding protein CbpA